MARTPADAALLLASMAGTDSEDPTTEVLSVDELTPGLDAGLNGVRIGLCPDLHLIPLAADVQEAFDGCVRTVAELGAELVEVALPEAGLAYPTFGVIQRAEALYTHTQAGLFPARQAEYGEDVRSRLELARSVGLSDYLAASADREQLRFGLARLFGRVDLLLTPVAATSPPTIGEERLSHLGRELDIRELVMTYTVPQDLAGLPTCAVRANFDALGIPVGIQITGPPRSEAFVLRAANALYSATIEIQHRWPNHLAAQARA